MAKSPKHALPFAGQEVGQVSVTVTNAGDGLSEALRLDPVELQFGQRVHLVIEGFVTQAKLKPVDHLDPSGKMALNYVIKAGVGTLVDEATVSGAIETTREKVLRAQEEAAGVARLDADGTAGTVHVGPPDNVEPGSDSDGFYDPALDAENGETPAPKSRSRKGTVTSDA